jgi:hypothetical protein
MRVQKVLKLLGIVFGAAISLFATVSVGLYFFIGSGCGNEVIAEVASPDNQSKAVVFQRDCGATTDFSTQVSVIKTSVGLGNSSGNVFSSDTNHGYAPAGAGGGPEVKVRWVFPSLLVVSHHPAARVFEAEQEVGLVKVQYEQLTQ